ncbi:MAG: DUF882 domain-containing protein [Pseudomonadota bacterium]
MRVFRTCKARFAAAVLAAASGVSATCAAAEERTISLYEIHTREKLSIVYKRNGVFVPAALEKLNWVLRDWRTNQPTKMDPKLFDLLWSIHRELGSKRHIHVISGYRSPKTNAMLRRTRGGQARRSQHMIGRAIDVHFPDVSVRRLRYSAMIREQGGVGYYPTSSLPFVHVDTGRVRHWPRMPRQELALLFPSGKTRHVPSDRRPLVRGDSRRAKASHPRLAVVVASFHHLRKSGPDSLQPTAPVIPDWSSRTQVAAAVPRPASPPPGLALAGVTSPGLYQAAPTAAPAPRLTTPPKLVAHAPNGLSANAPNALERRLLARLSALAANPGPVPPNPAAMLRTNGSKIAPPTTASWVAAPAFDDEHPDEMSYRPFPIAPYLTATSSSDDAALVRLTQPAPQLTVAFVSFGGSVLSSWLTRGRSRAVYPRVHRFQGRAVRVFKLMRPRGLDVATHPRLGGAPARRIAVR